MCLGPPQDEEWPPSPWGAAHLTALRRPVSRKVPLRGASLQWRQHLWMSLNKSARSGRWFLITGRWCRVCSSEWILGMDTSSEKRWERSSDDERETWNHLLTFRLVLAFLDGKLKDAELCDFLKDLCIVIAVFLHLIWVTAWMKHSGQFTKSSVTGWKPVWPRP